MTGPGVFVLRLGNRLRIGMSHDIPVGIRNARGVDWRDADVVAQIPTRTYKLALQLRRHIAFHCTRDMCATFAPVSERALRVCKRFERTLTYRREHDDSHLRRRAAQIDRLKNKTAEMSQ